MGGGSLPARPAGCVHVPHESSSVLMSLGPAGESICIRTHVQAFTVNVTISKQTKYGLMAERHWLLLAGMSSLQSQDTKMGTVLKTHQQDFGLSLHCQKVQGVVSFYYFWQPLGHSQEPCGTLSLRCSHSLLQHTCTAPHVQTVIRAQVYDLCPSSAAQEVIRSLWKVLDHMGVSQAQVCLLENLSRLDLSSSMRPTSAAQI